MGILIQNLGIFSIQTAVAALVSTISVEGATQLEIYARSRFFLLCICRQFIAKGIVFLGCPCVCTCVIMHWKVLNVTSYEPMCEFTIFTA